MGNEKLKNWKAAKEHFGNQMTGKEASDLFEETKSFGEKEYLKKTMMLKAAAAEKRKEKEAQRMREKGNPSFGSSKKKVEFRLVDPAHHRKGK